MSPLDINSLDVVRLILQFLLENNLFRSAIELSNESNVLLNCVENLDGLCNDIRSGRWDFVLKAIRARSLDNSVLARILEQCVIELVEKRELAAARALLTQTPALASMKVFDPDRYEHLATIVARPLFDPKLAWGNSSMQKQRDKLADFVAKEINQIPPARLLTLLSQSLKWQVENSLLNKDTPFDLFLGKEISFSDATIDAPPVQCYASIDFPNSHVEAAVFSPDGISLATGCSGGFIELWNPISGKIRNDLDFQREKKMMGMQNSIMSLAWSRDSVKLASGASDGQIKIWLAKSGVCERSIVRTHSKGVTCLCFTKDGTQVLSGGFDGIIKLHGLKSGGLLREFRGHSSFINAIAVSNDKIFSASSDGFVKIWNLNSNDAFASVSPAKNSIVSLIISKSGQIIATTQSKRVFSLNSNGKILWNGPAEDKQMTGKLALSASTSPHGDFCYILTDEGQVFNLKIGSNEHASSTVVGENMIGIASHPHANVFAVWSDKGMISLWKN